MATTIINNSVEEVLVENNINTNQLITYIYNDNKEIISCGVNTVLVNQICALVIEKIAEEVDVYKDVQIAIPLGNFVSNSAFSDYGPDIWIDIMPYGTAMIDYDRQFVQAGINQIKSITYLR